MNAELDIAGIGNAIVDILSHCDEAFLIRQQLPKGSMTLIDEMRADELYANIGQAVECSGGSAANTLAGLASLGAKTAFIGKVRNDTLGGIFRHDMQAVGVQFATLAATEGPGTARCLVSVTPDGERTMATYLGACAKVTREDIEEKALQASRITYIEGYLWDQPQAIEAIRYAIAIAKKAGKKVAFTLSDVFCVERHRQAFLDLLERDIDILFANEAEIRALFEQDSLDDIAARLAPLCQVAAITRSAEGCLIVSPTEIRQVPASLVKNIEDTTGAGDLFASGFLYGLCRGWNYERAAKLGHACAGYIIQQLGARATEPLTQFLH